MFSAQVSQPAKAAKYQYIEMTNHLASTENATQTNTTATHVILELYNGGKAPCFSIFLAYGQSATLATGARSPCVSSVEQIAVIPLTTRTYGAIYAPLNTVVVDPSLQNFAVKIDNLANPVFDVHNGALLVPGAMHLTFNAM